MNVDEVESMQSPGDGARPPRMSGADLVALAAVLGAFALSFVCYDRLPARVPVHFGIDGQPNGWMDRSLGAYFLPGFALLQWVILRVTPKVPAALRAAVTVLFVVVHAALLRAALGDGQLPPGLLPELLGVLWVVLGLVLPRTQRNRWVGIRTRATMASPEHWARVHRFAGWSFVSGGAVAMLFGLSGNVPGIAVAIAAIVVSAMAPTVYSALNPTKS